MTAASTAAAVSSTDVSASSDVVAASAATTVVSKDEKGVHNKGVLENVLNARISNGGKCLVPYITGGLGDNWLDMVCEIAESGADAIEIGIPFSDPVMDGPTIQKSSSMALLQGVTPLSVLSDLRVNADIAIPKVVMTYTNIAYRMGYERFAYSLAESGVSGCILPDMPLEEIEEWACAAKAAGLEVILLAAPTASDERLRKICSMSRGFVYGVGLAGVTGIRKTLASSAKVIAERLKCVSEQPVLVGVGVGTPQQAADVASVSDGVVVGSALMSRIVDGISIEGVGALVAEFRSALDGAV